MVDTLEPMSNNAEQIWPAIVMLHSVECPTILAILFGHPLFESVAPARQTCPHLNEDARGRLCILWLHGLVARTGGRCSLHGVVMIHDHERNNVGNDWS
jgi:hypothetical protein